MNEQALIEVVEEAIRSENHASLSIPLIKTMAKSIVKRLKEKDVFQMQYRYTGDGNLEVILDDTKMLNALKSVRAAWKGSGMPGIDSSESCLPIALLATVKLFLDLDF